MGKQGRAWDEEEDEVQEEGHCCLKNQNARRHLSNQYQFSVQFSLKIQESFCVAPKSLFPDSTVEP